MYDKTLIIEMLQDIEKALLRVIDRNKDIYDSSHKNRME